MSSFSTWFYVAYFFHTHTSTTEIYTLSLHDALPIYDDTANGSHTDVRPGSKAGRFMRQPEPAGLTHESRSEEHTSELQSRQYLVCRLLLEKKKKPELKDETQQ